MMDYACLVWRPAACTHHRKLQAQSRYFHFVTSTPWSISNMPVHEDLDIPFFADHLRTTKNFDSSAWNPPGSATWKALGLTKGWQSHLRP